MLVSEILRHIIVHVLLGQVVFLSPSEQTSLSVDYRFTTNGKTTNEQIDISVVPVEFPILDWMRELTPLHKPHFSWAIQSPLRENEPLLYEYVRLTHGCSITAQWAQQDHLNQCVRMCKQANATNPSIPATIGLNYLPYHYAFEEGDSPLPFVSEELDEKYQIEISRAIERFELMKTWLEAANHSLNSDIKIGAILLDSERFYYKPESDPDAEAWNLAITEKYNTIQNIVEGIFPNTRIEWYSRGQWVPSTADTGWSMSRHHPPDFSSPGYSGNTALYRVGDFGTTKEQFRRSVEYAALHNVNIMNLWVALGAGYASWDQQTKEVKKQWSFNWRYEHVKSWELGAHIDNPWYGNRPERYGPWNACQIVMFYPEPFGRTEDWGRHFIAYVRGAHNIKLLP